MAEKQSHALTTHTQTHTSCGLWWTKTVGSGWCREREKAKSAAQLPRWERFALGRDERAHKCRVAGESKTDINSIKRLFTLTTICNDKTAGSHSFSMRVADVRWHRPCRLELNFRQISSDAMQRTPMGRKTAEDMWSTSWYSSRDGTPTSNQPHRHLATSGG